MYCPTCGEPASGGANFCGGCGLNLEPVRAVIAGGQTMPTRDTATHDATRGDLPALGLSVEGLMAVEAQWAGVVCASTGKVNVSRRDAGGGREYMRFFLRGSCLQITCSKTKTHVARDLSEGKTVGEIFDPRALVESVLFDTIEGTTCLGYADGFAHRGRGLGGSSAPTRVRALRGDDPHHLQRGHAEPPAARVGAATGDPHADHQRDTRTEV
jgi:hypothetical protein